MRAVVVVVVEPELERVEFLLLGWVELSIRLLTA